jgi:hypothetical protein
MKLSKIPVNLFDIVFNTIGIVFCLMLIEITSSRIALWLKNKRNVKTKHVKLDIDVIDIPEVGRKLQNSFK